jgi:acetyltransferase-like isoleucine patch superfamily enzyme
MNEYKINAVKNDPTSKLKKYQALVIGSPDITALILYEFIALFITPVHGALGMLLRKFFYPFILKKVGKGVIFGRNITLRHPGKIAIGDNAVIDDNCMLDAKGETNQGITIGNGVFIGRNSILSCKDGDIILHDNVNIGFNCEIFSSHIVEIGNDTLLAAYTYIIGGEGYETSISDTPMSARPIDDKVKKVVIEADCWLGAGVKVLNGVTIKKGAIIGTGAVVTSSIEANMIAVGIPAKIIKQRPIDL